MFNRTHHKVLMAFDDKYAEKYRILTRRRKLSIDSCVKSLTKLFLEPYILTILYVGLLLKIYLNLNGFLLGIALAFTVTVLVMIFVCIKDELENRKELKL